MPNNNPNNSVVTISGIELYEGKILTPSETDKLGLSELKAKATKSKRATNLMQAIAGTSVNLMLKEAFVILVSLESGLVRIIRTDFKNREVFYFQEIKA